MADKKETLGYIAVIAALIGCCLLLTTALTGGALTFFGISLKNNWLLLFGLGIIILTIIVVIWNKFGIKKEVKNDKKEGYK